MNMKNVLALFVTVAFLLAMFNTPVHATTNTVVPGSDFESHCNTPDKDVVVGVVVGKLQYNVSEIHVNKGECFTIVFQNLDPSVEHDFVIQKVGGSSNLTAQDVDLNKAEINHVDFDSAGPTTDYGWGANGIDKFNVSAPKVDATFSYFCDVEGHRAGGMEGKLIVGNGAPSAPGFELIPAFLGIFAVAGIVKIYRKKQI